MLPEVDAMQLHANWISTSSSSGHEVRPINDLSLPHDYTRPIASLMVVQFLFQRSRAKEMFWVSNVFHPADMI
jgi:hypothetical protein